MMSLLDAPTALSCQQMNTIFFRAVAGCRANRLAPIYSALPSFRNPNFVVMSQFLNGEAKAWVSTSCHTLESKRF